MFVQVTYSPGVPPRRVRDIEHEIAYALRRAEEDAAPSSAARPRPPDNTPPPAPPLPVPPAGSVVYADGFAVDRRPAPAYAAAGRASDVEDVDVPRYDLRPAADPAADDVVVVGGGGSGAAARPGGRGGCFNCGAAGHEVRDCPDPIDRARVKAAADDAAGRRGGGGGPRYCDDAGGAGAAAAAAAASLAAAHPDVRPGALSPALRVALGMPVDDLGAAPPFAARMKRAGYPPGYLSPPVRAVPGAGGAGGAGGGEPAAPRAGLGRYASHGPASALVALFDAGYGAPLGDGDDDGLDAAAAAAGHPSAAPAAALFETAADVDAAAAAAAAASRAAGTSGPPVVASLDAAPLAVPLRLVPVFPACECGRARAVAYPWLLPAAVEACAVHGGPPPGASVSAMGAPPLAVPAALPHGGGGEEGEVSDMDT
jgi:hypothetical protein